MKAIVCLSESSKDVGWKVKVLRKWGRKSYLSKSEFWRFHSVAREDFRLHGI